MRGRGIVCVLSTVLLFFCFSGLISAESATSSSTALKFRGFYKYTDDRTENQDHYWESSPVPQESYKETGQFDEFAFNGIVPGSIKLSGEFKLKITADNGTVVEIAEKDLQFTHYGGYFKTYPDIYGALYITPYKEYTTISFSTRAQDTVRAFKRDGGEWESETPQFGQFYRAKQSIKVEIVTSDDSGKVRYEGSTTIPLVEATHNYDDSYYDGRYHENRHHTYWTEHVYEGTSEGEIPITPSTTTETHTIQMKANTVWQDTGIDIPAGAHVAIKTTGKASYHYYNEKYYLGSDGSPYTKAWEGFLLPGAKAWSLIGRIGSEGEGAFQAGSSFSLETAPAGRLYLSMNDNYFKDNIGEWTVVVTIESPSN